MTRLDSAPAEAFAECTCIDSSRHTVDNHLKRVICSFLGPLKTQLKERILVMANQTAEQETAPVTAEGSKPKYPGIPVTCNGNQLVAQWVELIFTGMGCTLVSTVRRLDFPNRRLNRVQQLSAACLRGAVCGGQNEAMEHELQALQAMGDTPIRSSNDRMARRAQETHRRSNNGSHKGYRVNLRQ